jgi:hypothetical protein
MVIIFKSKAIFFLVLFCHFSLSASENLHYWIKSHQWEKIDSEFKTKSPSRESEVYALIEFYEKSPDADPEKRFHFLISQAKGSFVTNYNRSDIDQILQNPTPYQSVVFRLSFWKLYQELDKRRILSSEEKLTFLNKFNFDLDPVSRRAFDEYTKVALDSEKFTDLVQKVQSLGSEEKRFYLQQETWLRYAKALARLGELKKAQNEYISLSQDSGTPDYIRNFIVQDLKKYLPNDALLSLRPEDLIGLMNQLDPKEADSFYTRNKQFFRSRQTNGVSFFQAGKYLASNDEGDSLIALILSNKPFLETDDEYLTKFGDIIFGKGKFSTGIRVLERFPEYKEAGKYRVLALCYEKLNQRENYFKNLIRYLAEYPFNLHYQDKLIEFLIQKNGNSTSYQSEVYWNRALEEMPDLPVKGRLYYWYFRYLQDTGKSDQLKKELDIFYPKIAGSYYTRVIREEFSSLIQDLDLPSNPTENKTSLHRYLSRTAGVPDLSPKILRKNLGFAYFDKSFELGIRLTQIQSKIKSDRILGLSADYFRLGEDSLGMSLFQFYAKEKSLGQIEKEEILVGIGEISNNHYYSAFYTRSLLKRLRIPDDPILLPTSVSERIYPRPHRDLVQRHSRDAGISEDIVYAIMRQESFYKETAISRSNAQGLMQIMPATGRELARNLGVSSYSLFNPNTSIQFGSRFLAYLMKSNENDMRWASIAYNGGPGNLRKWKRNHYRGDFNHFLEDVPYKESRDYCRITVSNFYAYEIMRRYHGL